MVAGTVVSIAGLHRTQNAEVGHPDIVEVDLVVAQRTWDS